MTGIDSTIMTTLEAKLATLSWVKLVTWKRIRLANSDFRDYEIPLIQFYDAGQQIAHEAARLQVTWNISVELVLKSYADGAVDMEDLLEKRQEVEQKIGEQPNLGIAGLLHFRYIGNEPDTFTILPYYYTRMDFQAIYYKPYKGNC